MIIRMSALGLALALVLGMGWGEGGWGARPALAQSTTRSGESRVEVPNVRGKRRAEAERLLDQAGFSTVQIYEVDTDKRGLSGVVRDQSPPPGRELPVSTVIKLNVYRYEP